MQSRPAVSVLVFCMVLAVAFSLSATGVWDWSEAAATYEGARHTVLQYGQFPLWSPYLCGGYPAIGNPQTYWLSPVFLFVLLFGSIVGPKLAVAAYIFIGAIGMWLLARRLEIAHPAALLAAPVYLTSGFMAIHLSGGQFLWLSLAWVPWVFWGYLKGRHNLLYLTAGAAALTIIGLSGRSNVVAYIVLMLGSLGFIEDVIAWRRGEPLGSFRRAVVLLVLAFGLGAWKFVPDLFFMADVDHKLPEVLSISSLWILGQFLARDISVHQVHEDVSLVEYGYYTGLLPLLLAGGALLTSRVRQQAAPWLFVGSMMLAVALSGSANILELLPVFDELRNAQRAMSMVIFVLALFAAWGLSLIPRRLQWAVLVLAVVDLLTLSAPLLAREFSKEAGKEEEATVQEFSPLLVQDEGFDPFPTVATNRGAKSFCPAVVSAWRPTTPVVAVLHHDYRGEVYLVGPGTFSLLSYTPNRIVIDVESEEGTRAVINQNAAHGWWADAGSVTATADGLLAVDIPPGRQTVALSFFPPGLILGAVGTLLTVLLLLLTGYLRYARTQQA